MATSPSPFSNAAPLVVAAVAPTMSATPPLISSPSPPLPAAPVSASPLSLPNATPDLSATPPPYPPPLRSPPTLPLPSPTSPATQFPSPAAEAPPSAAESPPPSSPPPTAPPPIAPPSPALLPPTLPSLSPPRSATFSSPPPSPPPPPPNVTPSKVSTFSPPSGGISPPPPVNNTPSSPPQPFTSPSSSSPAQPSSPASPITSPLLPNSPPPSSPVFSPPPSSKGFHSTPVVASPQRRGHHNPQDSSLSSPALFSPLPPGPSNSSSSTPTPLVPSPSGIAPPLASQNSSAIPSDTARPSNPSSNKSSFLAREGGRNSNSGLGSGPTAAISVLVALLGAILVGVVLLYFRKRRKPRGGYNSGFVMPSFSTSPQKSGDSAYARSPSAATAYSSYGAGSQGLRASGSEKRKGFSGFFTYEELYNITDGFSALNLLGEGGFGSVYKGCLPDGRVVAVKQLRDGGGQGEREFQAEVEIISRVHHRHLVSLVGYCIYENQRLLVYDFVPNNTLHHHLHVHDNSVLEWSVRIRVAAGAARGLAYLHEDCHPRIIHRDIKSSNILLDNNFEARVADFGLARLAVDTASHVTTRVMGTFGYLAPEYASTGKLTDRSDVFSFGVVLLELITGRKPVDASRPLGDESLVEWARPLLGEALETRNFEELVDPRLEKNYDGVEMYRMIEAAAACVRHSSTMRPRMSQVVRILDSLSDVDINNGIQPGKSELFSVANSAEIRLFQHMAFGSPGDSYNYSLPISNS